VVKIDILQFRCSSNLGEEEEEEEEEEKAPVERDPDHLV
jgi:hypothetical protein